MGESHAKDAFPSMPACHVTTSSPPPPLPDVFPAPSLMEGCECFISKLNTSSCAFLSRRILRYKPYDCEKRDFSRNVSLCAHQPPHVTATPTNLYWTYGYLFTANPLRVFFPPDHFRWKQTTERTETIYIVVFFQIELHLKIKAR